MRSLKQARPGSLMRRLPGFFLSAGGPRYSVSGMRVEVAFELDEASEKLEIPWESSNPDIRYFDLREDTKLIERLEVARQHPPLRNFLTAMNSADSLFATARCKTWLTQQDPGSGAASGAATAPGTSMEPCQFASQVDLVFTPEQFNFNRSQYAELTGRLVELLTRESAPDALRVALRARACHFRAPSRWGFCLAVFLYARGATPEQAEVRWGLGLVRIQQALLFTSRILRQKIARTS